jgi:hypothetical protein
MHRLLISKSAKQWAACLGVLGSAAYLVDARIHQPQSIVHPTFTSHQPSSALSALARAVSPLHADDGESNAKVSSHLCVYLCVCDEVLTRYRCKSVLLMSHITHTHTHKHTHEDDAWGVGFGRQRAKVEA